MLAFGHLTFKWDASMEKDGTFDQVATKRR
jgi:hypothetical protein